MNSEFSGSGSLRWLWFVLILLLLLGGLVLGLTLLRQNQELTDALEATILGDQTEWLNRRVQRKSSSPVKEPRFIQPDGYYELPYPAGWHVLYREDCHPYGCGGLAQFNAKPLLVYTEGRSPTSDLYFKDQVVLAEGHLTAEELIDLASKDLVNVQVTEKLNQTGLTLYFVNGEYPADWSGPLDFPASFYFLVFDPTCSAPVVCYQHTLQAYVGPGLNKEDLPQILDYLMDQFQLNAGG